jgi:hypothetical protein
LPVAILMMASILVGSSCLFSQHGCWNRSDICNAEAVLKVVLNCTQLGPGQAHPIEDCLLAEGQVEEWSGDCWLLASGTNFAEN